ncbi:kinesin-like protein, partial [Trypanosoma rangeli]
SLDAVTTERDRLQERLATTTDTLSRQLREVEEAKTQVEHSLEAVTTERDGLQERLATTTDTLSRQLREVEEAKTQVEHSLDAVTMERDAGLESFTLLVKDHESVVAACDKLREDLSVAGCCNGDEVAKLKSENARLSDDLSKALFMLDAANVRLNYLRSVHVSDPLSKSIEGGEDYQVTRSVLEMWK